MINEINGHDREKNKEVVGAAAETSMEQDEITATVRRMVTQCGALLRVQLAHRARQEPLTYDQARIDRVIREFEASAEDIQVTIANRVRSRLTSHLQLEIMRVLKDALGDAVESIEDPIWNHGVESVPPAIEGEPPRRSEEQRPAVKEDTPDGQRMGMAEFYGVGEATWVPPKQRTPERPTLAVAQAQDVVPEVSRLAHQVAPPSEPEEQGLPEKPPQESPGEVYEGTVKLRVEATDSVRQVIQFVDALRRRSDFRLLQLVGSYNEGVSIWLVLRVPLPLKEALLQMEGVSQVDASRWLEREGSEPLLNVRLAEALSPK